MIELEVHGDPGACRLAATAAAGVATKVDDAADALQTAISTSTAAWVGIAGDGFRSTATDTRKSLADLADRIRPAGRALETFADELDVVRSKLADARADAVAAGLRVSGSTIAPPTPPTEPAAAADPATVEAYNAQVDVHNARVKAYDAALEQAQDARDKEDDAHERLVKAMKASNGDGFVENLLEKLGFAPPDGMDGLEAGSWLFGLGGLGFGLAAGTMLKGQLQIFQPRVNGRFASAAGMDFWERLAAASKDSSWHAKAYQAATRDQWAAAGRWASRAGTVVTAGTSAWGQWKDDADDPSLDTAERVDRAATKGAATAAGAWAGAEVGAWAGGAIGTAICPGVGTVIGGAVGGLVGGFAGSSAGGWVGDQINDAADGIGHAAADVVDGAADLAEDVGDALSFWD